MTLPTRAAPLDRRGFLAGTLALPLLQLPAAAARPTASAARLTLAQVLAEAHALAAVHLTGPRTNEEAWVHAATALFAQLETLPPDPFGDMTQRETAFLAQHTWTYRRVDGAPADRRRPAVITHQIHVAPGGRIPLHDHRGMFGAIVCADGELEIRSFDVVEGGRDTDAVTLQETVRAWLCPGRYSLLTQARDNVHEFRAGPKGARVLDLFVWLTDDTRSHDLAWIDDPAGAPAGRRYRARWA